MRRVVKEVAAGAGGQNGKYVPFNRDDCKHKSWATSLGQGFRLQFMVWTNRGCMSEFVVNIQVLTADDGWETVEYVDCCHGHYHLHRTSGAVDSLVRLDSVDDVKMAFAQVRSHLDGRVRILKSNERDWQ